MSESICVVGPVNIELALSAKRLPRAGEELAAGELEVSPGGSGTLMAVAAARLGAHVELLGAVGDDVWGSQLRSALVTEGVDVSHLTTRTDAASPARVSVIVPDGRSARLRSAPKRGFLNLDDLEELREAIGAAQCLLVSSNLPKKVLERVLQRGVESKVPIFLYVTTNAPPRELLNGIEMLVCSTEMAEELLGLDETVSPAGLARRLGALGPRRVVVAPSGSRAVMFDGEQVIDQLSGDSEVTDERGAREAFVVALAQACLGGLRLKEALRCATVAGGIAGGREGTLESLPNRDAYESACSRTAPTA